MVVVIYLYVQFNQRKMEDYEKFCEKHLARLQGESLPKEISLPTQHKNISLIQFHGIPVLSPLVSVTCKYLHLEKAETIFVHLSILGYGATNHD